MTTASGETTWRRRGTPLRRFVETETGGATVLVTAIVVALIWASMSAASYDTVWRTPISIRVGDAGVSLTARGWINSGLMAVFFFVAGLEARREFDLGELRQRRRIALPVLAAMGGMIVPVVAFLAVNAGEPSVRAWGAAMSTDTALALGVLAIAGRRLPSRLRVFMLTITLADDLGGIAVIAVAYSGSIDLAYLLISVAIFAAVLLARALRTRTGLIYFLLAAASWLAL